MRAAPLVHGSVFALVAGLLFARPAAAQSLIVNGGGMPAEGPLTYSGPDAVQIHIEGNGGTLLEESTSGWQPVCLIPCTTTVNPRGNFKLGGLLLKESDAFQFPAGGPLQLMAHTASSIDMGGFAGGITLLSLGIAPIVLGSLFFAGGFDSSDSPSTSDHLIGGAILGAGAVMVAIGIYMLVDRPTTSISIVNGPRLARRTTTPSLRLPSALAALGPAGLAF